MLGHDTVYGWLKKKVIIFTPKNKVAKGFCLRRSVQKFKMPSPN